MHGPTCEARRVVNAGVVSADILADFISQNESINEFLKSQLPDKIFNVSLTIPHPNIKLTVVLGS